MARYLDKVLPDGWSGPGSPATKVINVLTTLYASGRTRVTGIPLPDWRKSTGRTGALGTTPSGGDLGLSNTAGIGMAGTSTNNTSATDAARLEVQLPDNYVAGGAITFKVRARSQFTRFVAQTVAISAKKIADNVVGAELCTTSAITITTGYADYGFSITPTGLVAGDILAIILTVIANDTGGAAGASQITVPKAWLEYQGT